MTTFFKIARLNQTIPITDQPASVKFSRLWDIVSNALESLMTDSEQAKADLGTLTSGAAYRDQDNTFTGLNIFQQYPMSLRGYSVNNKIVVQEQDGGWTVGTGTPDKGVFATYAGNTHGAGYSQTKVQELDDAAVAASQRLLTIEQALEHHGLIGA